MSLSDYEANRILDSIFSNDVYVGLSTGNPGNSGSGLAEPSGNGYTRIKTISSDWNSASGRSKSNKNKITFSTAQGDWGTIGYFALFDASTGGNMIASGTVSPAQSVLSENTIEIDVGNATITIN